MNGTGDTNKNKKIKTTIEYDNIIIAIYYSYMSVVFV